MWGEEGAVVCPHPTEYIQGNAKSAALNVRSNNSPRSSHCVELAAHRPSATILHSYYFCHDFTFLILQAGVPIVILRCIDSLELKDTGKPVALLAKLTSQKPLAFHLVGRGMLEATRMRKLLNGSSPKEVVLDVLMIVSELARMDKVIF